MLVLSQKLPGAASAALPVVWHEATPFLLQKRQIRESETKNEHAEAHGEKTQEIFSSVLCLSEVEK